MLDFQILEELECIVPAVKVEEESFNSIPRGILQSFIATALFIHIK